MHPFGWGDPVDIFLSFKADGKVKAVRSHGHEDLIKEETELPYYQRWTIDMPEAGPMTIFLPAPTEPGTG